MKKIVLLVALLGASYAFAENKQMSFDGKYEIESVRKTAKLKSSEGRAYIQTDTGIRKAVINTIIVAEYTGECEMHPNPSAFLYNYSFKSLEVLKGKPIDVVPISKGFQQNPPMPCETYTKGERYLLLMERIANRERPSKKKWLYVPVNAEAIIPLKE